MEKLLEKMDGRKFYIGIAAILIVALGEAFAPGAAQELFAEIDLLDPSTVEGTSWSAWMLWAVRSAIKKLEV